MANEIVVPSSEDKRITQDASKLMKEFKDLFEDSKDKMQQIKKKLFKVLSDQTTSQRNISSSKNKALIFQKESEELATSIDSEIKKKTLLENLSRDLQSKNLELCYEYRSLRLAQNKYRKQLQKRIRTQAKEETDVILRKKSEISSILKENEFYYKSVEELEKKVEERVMSIHKAKGIFSNSFTMEGLSKSIDNFNTVFDEEASVKSYLEECKAQFDKAKQQIEQYYPKFASLKHQIEEASKRYTEMVEEKQQFEIYPKPESVHSYIQLKQDIESYKEKKATLLRLKEELSKACNK